MIVTISIALGSALLHWFLQRQAAARYEKCMREAIEATKAAKGAHHMAEASFDMVAQHHAALQPALAMLPKTRTRKAKPVQA